MANNAILTTIHMTSMLAMLARLLEIMNIHPIALLSIINSPNHIFVVCIPGDYSLLIQLKMCIYMNNITIIPCNMFSWNLSGAVEVTIFRMVFDISRFLGLKFMLLTKINPARAHTQGFCPDINFYSKNLLSYKPLCWIW